MKYVCLSFFPLLLTACHLNQNVAIRGMDLHTHEVNGSTTIDLEAIISLGNLKLPNTNFPIQNSEQQNIGEVAIQHLEDGTSRIALSIDDEEASKMDSSLGKTLPNGREIPAFLENEQTLIGIPILQGSRVYIGGNPKGTLYAGIALHISAFDHILSKIADPLNLFLSFPFSDEVFGVAGIYTSPHLGQNGLALFAKKSQQAKTVPYTNELQKVDPITLLRLNYLFNKHAILRIK